jgi:hypothetical protein
MPKSPSCPNAVDCSEQGLLPPGNPTATRRAPTSPGDGGEAGALRGGGPSPHGTSPRGGRAAPGSILSEGEYEAPILLELLERGGKGHTTEVINTVGERLEGELTELDRDRLDTGEIRWRNVCSSPGSPRGIWELSEAGRKTAEAAGNG